MMNIKPVFTKLQIASQVANLAVLFFLFVIPALLSRGYAALPGYWHEAGQMIRRITESYPDTEQKRREWLLNSSLKRDLWVMMTLPPAVPFLASWDWEVRQALGLAAYSYGQGMQWKQMAADHLGALAGVLILYFLVRHWYRRRLEDA